MHQMCRVILFRNETAAVLGNAGLAWESVIAKRNVVFAQAALVQEIEVTNFYGVANKPAETALTYLPSRSVMLE